MHMNHRFFILVSVLLALSGGVALAQEGRLASPLDCTDPLPGGLNGCVLRLPAGHEAPSVQATKPGSGDSFPASSWSLLDADGLSRMPKVDISGTLILVDVSQSGKGRRAVFDRFEKEAIKDLVRAMPSTELISLYSFGADRREIVRFTRDQQSILSAIDDLTLGETNTLIQRNVMDAIQLMDAEPTIAIGRVLLVSDGLDEDALAAQDNRPLDAIKLAQDTGISVSVMGSFWQSKGSPDIGRGRGYLEALAEETAGEFGGVEYAKRSETADLVANLSDRLRQARNASRLVVLNAGVRAEPATIVVKVDMPVVPGSAQRKSVDYTATYQPLDADGEPIPAPAPPKKPAPKPAVKPEPVEADFVATALAWAQTYWYVLAGVGGAILLGLLVLVISRSRGGETDDFATDIDIEPSIVDSTPPPLPQQVLAVLVEKSSGRNLRVTSGRVSIGRGTKNDIILPHNSVSRAHAVLQIEPNGFMAITDLQSLNGTFVNNTRVTESQKLRFGDAIKIGDVMLILQTA